MPRTTARVAMIMAVLGVSCGGALPAVPGQGGPAWRELTSPHFTMWTDAEPSQARALIRQMEHLRQVIVGVAFPSTPSAGRVMVFALRDDGELAAASPLGQPRAFARTSQFPLWPPVIVVSAFSNRRSPDTTLAHEVTHVISFGVFRHQPRWLGEGMATYFETVQLDADRATAEVGRAPQHRGAAIRQAALVPVSRLFGWSNAHQHEEREYSTARALFTFLINQHRDELLRYLQLLQREGKSRDELSADDSRRLWDEAFPSLPLGEVDVAMRQWLLTGSHVISHFKVQRHQWPVAERALSDADVHATRAYLHVTARNPGKARADLAAALAAEPTNVVANLLAKVLDDKTHTVEQARAIAVAHPGDWRAWLLAAIALREANGDPAEAETARAKCCRLLAHNPALVAPQELCPQPAAKPPP
jgi:hypothetical protein